MISVCGPNDSTPDEYQIAMDVGRGIAESGHALVCGGRGGVMEAAARGAQSAGGVTIGILPEYDAAIANEFIDYPIPTGLGHARNVLVVASGEAVIAIGGGFGTLSEIGLALKMGKRVVHIGSWDLDPERMARYSDPSASYLQATSASDAVQLATSAKPASPNGDG
jgi:uncharacterized protein (TIGR00725 family)